MINRRQFVRAGAAGAVLAGIPGAFAATYDLIIKGGRVIDPASGLDAVRDLAIAGGKI
jgi:dihydroorotase